MSGEKLWAALGGVRDGYVTEAVEYQKNRRTWVRWAALAACLCLVAGGVLAWRWSRPGGAVGCDELPPRHPASEDPKDVPAWSGSR